MNPAEACPVITAFLHCWKDRLPDAERDALLRPLVPLLIGTRAGLEEEQRRSYLALDWLVRECCPAWLRLAGLTDAAAGLEALPEFVGASQCNPVPLALRLARKQAHAAWRKAPRRYWTAVAEAEVAVEAMAATAEAAMAVQASAAEAAVVVARRAAEVAALAAVAAEVAAAARATTAATLEPTRLVMQASVLRLVHRMIAVRAAP